MDTVYLCDPELNAACRERSLTCAYRAETPPELRTCISTTKRECAMEDRFGNPCLDPFYAERRAVLKEE